MPCHLREKTEYTPNDYEISFQTNQIPKNINVTNAKNLKQELQKAMPLTKPLHLKLIEIETSVPNNNLRIKTDIKVTQNKNDLGVEIL